MGTFSMGSIIRTKEDGYIHLVNVPQKNVFYTLAWLAGLLSAMPFEIFDD